MKRNSNITAWQLRLFEGFDRDVMVMQRDEEEVFDDAIHVFFEKDYYDAYLAKAKKYSIHRYAYHEDKLGEVVNQIFEENIPGLVIHMETQEKGLCEEKYLEQKSLYPVKDPAENYHNLFMASIERMPKEEAIAKLWTKSVYVIGQLPDPRKAGEKQKVELMTQRRKADGAQATSDDFDYEALKVFLTPESAMRFNPDKKPINKYKLITLATFVKGRLHVIIEPHRNYFVEFDPATLDISEYFKLPVWDEEAVKERAKEFAALDECYCLLAPQVADYRNSVSAPFLLKMDEKNIMLNVYEKYEDAVRYCQENPAMLPIRDGVYPIGKIEKSDKIHCLETLCCVTALLGVQNINLDLETNHGIGMKLSFFQEAVGFEPSLDNLLSAEDVNKMRVEQDGKTLYRLPIYKMVDTVNEYAISEERKTEIKKHIEEDTDKALAFLSGCTITELIFALSEIGRKFDEVKKEVSDSEKKEYSIWLNVVTVLLTEAMMEKPYVFTLRNDDQTFTQKNNFSYLIVTDRFENIRNNEGKLTLAGIDNENFMQKFVESSNVAIITDGPDALSLADARIIFEASKAKKKNEALKEEVLIYLTQGLDMSYEDANKAYKRLKTDNSIFVEFLSTFRNGQFPPMGMITINGYTAQKLCEEKKLNYFEAYNSLLNMKLNPDMKVDTIVTSTVSACETDSNDNFAENTEEKKSLFGKLFKK